MTSARLVIDPRFPVGNVDRRLFGSFVEHLGRCVYDGIYEPGHPASDENGFRQDVLELVRELGVSMVRYPGGNFVSGYKWEEAIGPKADRPRRLDMAWHSVETNEVGLDEFARWAKLAEVETMYAVNLGTRGIEDALAVLEYANVESGTTLSQQRIDNGTEKPHDIRMWCLGNEMDGPWQLGFSTAEEYGSKAAQVAKAMLQLDSTLQLVVCGSSSAHMPTFGAWEQTVLRKTYADVTHISCHAYYEETDGDTGSFLASAVDMDFFIDSIVATADAIGAELHNAKRIEISFDEWNVWYQSRYQNEDRITAAQDWPYAPRLLEDIYSVLDAVVFGNLMISLLKHADRVTSASLAQLVNVIAPIMTEPGGAAWRQTTFFPFATTARLAKGRSLQTIVTSDRYNTQRFGDVDFLDSAATWDAATGEGAIFLVNRHQTETMTLSVDMTGFGPVQISEALTLSDDDIRAVNDLANQTRVSLKPNESVSMAEGTLLIELPPVSWSAISFEGKNA
ncbi:alpha-N-arabinofuranosidase [Cryobacterium lactosi]|uniref:non-reducing end alpha-L-arabinofuranosidase n=1 Tax=Cryobacterium lactosi TaxID=1259202 RepID=A0A4V3IX92_9MICO|nr:alpha-N-arabinofuranosidase [Cryobacterium lactosi]TFD89373.1 alpha-N-arabinofuranosidase [Cryobacterium lactosi]